MSVAVATVDDLSKHAVWTALSEYMQVPGSMAEAAAVDSTTARVEIVGHGVAEVPDVAERAEVIVLPVDGDVCHRDESLVVPLVAARDLQRAHIVRQQQPQDFTG